MAEYLAAYEKLLREFLNGTISVDVFSSAFLNRFKIEAQLDETLFLLLDELFGDIDSFTGHERLLAENPGFYLDEAGLRERVQRTADRLLEIKNHSSA
jgi:hypothetical protein